MRGIAGFKRVGWAFETLMSPGKMVTVSFMTDLGKLLMAAGLLLALAGTVIWLLGRSGFRGLPGDIRYEGENFRFYFPIVTSLALSVIGTLILWLWHWWKK